MPTINIPSFLFFFLLFFYFAVCISFYLNGLERMERKTTKLMTRRFDPGRIFLQNRTFSRKILLGSKRQASHFVLHFVLRVLSVDKQFALSSAVTFLFNSTTQIQHYNLLRKSSTISTRNDRRVLTVSDKWFFKFPFFPFLFSFSSGFVCFVKKHTKQIKSHW